jgi:O-methyltransferase involved in polyketide biosynthesis
MTSTRPSRRAGDRISPTAYYTGHVWYRNGLSVPELDTRQGALLFTSLAPMMAIGRALTGGVALEEMLLQRHKILDHLLAQAIDSGRVGQVLEIAGGLSGRGVRFSRRYPEVAYVEGDLPVMAARKRARLGAEPGARPRHAVVELDVLASSGPLSIDEATRGHFDPAKGIAIVTEGLLSYLDPASVSVLWRHLATFAASFPSDVYFSDLYLGGMQRSRAVAAFRRMLEVFSRGRTHLHFTRIRDVAPAMAEHGFASARVHRPRDWAAALSLPGAGGLETVQILEASTRPG